MILFAFFTNAGVPATGLAPTIDVWDSASNHPVDAQAMSEIAGGWYKYPFAAYDDTVDYVIRADGGAGLSNFERYVTATNETDSAVSGLDDMLKFLESVAGGRLRIVGNQLILYEDDNVTVVATFDLFDASGNPAMVNVMERVRV